MNHAARTSSKAPPELAAAWLPDTDWEVGVSLTGYDVLGAAEHFDEPVRGLQTRELLGTGVFRRFFGAWRAS